VLASALPSEHRQKEAMVATADDCREAFDSLLARLSDLDERTRREIPTRTLSCHITDLGVTFLTTIGSDGAQPLAEAPAGAPRAQVRFSAKSGDVMTVAARPESFARLWLTRRVKVDASLGDLAILRKFL
jgi:predicted lipid carrier protein YhbT